MMNLLTPGYAMRRVYRNNTGHIISSSVIGIGIQGLDSVVRMYLIGEVSQRGKW